MTDHKNQQVVKILANKVLTKNAEKLGDMAARGLKDLTRLNTFFTRTQMLEMLNVSIRHSKDIEKPANVSSAEWKQTVRHVGKKVADSTLSDSDLCPSYKTSRGDTLYTTPDLVTAEADIRQTSAKMNNSGQEWFSASDAAKGQDLFKKSRAQMGWDVAPRLVESIEELAGPGNLKLFNGPPGSGKTAVCEAYVLAMMGAGKELPQIITTAPTDKAASGLHADVQDAVHAAENLGCAKEKPVKSQSLDDLFTSFEKGQVAKNSLIMVDEAGLMGSRDMARLLTGANKAGARLLMVGDNRQIPPNLAGNGFDLMTRTMADNGELKVHQFTDILRQKNPDEALASKQIRQGNALTALEFYQGKTYPDGDKPLTFVDSSMDVTDKIVNDYVADSLNPETAGNSAIVLASTQQEADKLNNKLRAKLMKAGVLGHEVEVSTDSGPRGFAANDELIFDEKVSAFDKQGKNASVNAGVTAKVKNVTKDTVTLDMGKDKELRVPAREAGKLSQARALSLFRAQGVGRHTAYLCLSTKSGLDLGAGLVGFTRHTKKLKSVVSKAAFPDIKSLAKTMEQLRSKPMVHDIDRNPKPMRKQEQAMQTAAARIAARLSR